MTVRLAVIGLLLLTASKAGAQDAPEFVHEAIFAIEQMLASEGDESLGQFMADAMAPDAERDQAATLEFLASMREELRAFGDDIAVEAAPGGFRLILMGPGGERVVRVEVDEAGISQLELEEAREAVSLEVTRENLPSLFDDLESEGLAGIVHVRLDGELVLERAFGMANPELGVPNRLDTVFGTGSRPIDYTVAAILLLDQRGQLDIDDPIAAHVPSVPADKQSMTIRHCLNGQSGLPDFFDNEEDWDPDLAWIDRETAERRLLAQTLLFAPGTADEHSHGAFGLLAAVVERVSGEGYYEFIRHNFLDPAGMDRTGEYGESRGLAVADFAAGAGPQLVGMPNIPPNWGPTSWLVKGSGGMYSTLGDLLGFYALLRTGDVLDEAHRARFLGPTINLDGSDRGFELFSAYDGADNEVLLFLNSVGDRDRFRALVRGLEGLVFPR